MNVKNLRESIKQIVLDVLEYEHGIDIYQVLLVKPETYTVNIKQLNGYKSFIDVDFIGQSFGNGKGNMQLPNVDDLVLVAFLKDSEKPFILGSVFNKYMREQDSIISIKENEWFVNNKINGSYIFIDENNIINLFSKSKINVKTENSSVEIEDDNSILIKNKNGFAKLNSDGTITLNAFTFPKTDGSAGQVLKTNGSGVLSWSNDNTS